MIREDNAVFINPLAYRIFPNIPNPRNTGTQEEVRFSGTLKIKDSTGNTRYYNNINTIDLSVFTGWISIDYTSPMGSTRLGRWLI